MAAPPHTETAPRWKRRKDERPDEILAAALQLFSEHGYAATRLEDVAARAGVSKGTLYLYFDTKAALFKALVRSALIPNIAHAEAVVDGYQGPTRELLADLLTGFSRLMLGSPLSGIPKLVISEAGNFPEIAGFYYQEVILRSNALIRRLLERGAERGEFRSIDAEAAWRVVVAPLILAVLWKHSFQRYEDAPPDFDRYARAHLDLLFNGLQSPAPENAAPKGHRPRKSKGKRP
jgi:AcrR family transcriptional regulator